MKKIWISFILYLSKTFTRWSKRLNKYANKEKYLFEILQDKIKSVNKQDLSLSCKLDKIILGECIEHTDIPEYKTNTIVLPEF